MPQIKEILKTKYHRTSKIPNGQWKFYQEWNNVVFLHWQVELTELRKFVPKEIEIDFFEGKPWVSVVAFTMEKIRPKNLPAFRPISNFDEINIRTYVNYNGKTGVYFLSIEGGKKLSCKVAKGISELPYRYSKMKRQEGIYSSENSQYSDSLLIDFNIGESISDKTNLDLWLTERYALIQDTKNSINEFDIHHVEWPIRNIKIKKLKLNYRRFNKLLTNNPNKVNYSEGVQVIAWDKKKNWL